MGNKYFYKIRKLREAAFIGKMIEASLPPLVVVARGVFDALSLLYLDFITLILNINSNFHYIKHLNFLSVCDIIICDRPHRLWSQRP